MTFGQWIINQLNQINRKYEEENRNKPWIPLKSISVYQLENDCNFGKGAVYRWDSKGHFPRMDSFMRVINQLSIYTQRSRESLFIEALQKIEVK